MALTMNLTNVQREQAEFKTETGEIVTLTDAKGEQYFREMKAEIVPVQSGSGNPSPDNVRPISGFSEAKVWDDPKYGGSIEWNQLFETTARTTNDGIITRYNSTTHQIEIENVSRTTNYNSGSVRSALFHSTKGHVYCLFRSPDVTGITYVYQGHTSSLNSLFKADQDRDVMLRVLNTYDFVTAHPIGDVTSFYMNVLDVTQMFGATKADEIYAMEVAQSGSGVAWVRSLFNKDYYAYNSGEVTCVSAVNGDEYRHVTISFGQTVYGGTLDVRRGKVTVTHKAFIFTGTENFTTGGLGGITAVYIIPNSADALLWVQHPEQDTVNFKCSHYVWADYIYTPSFTEIKVSEGSGGYNERITFMNSLKNQTMTEFKAYLASQYSANTPVTVYAPLATPFELSVTPEAIKTLVGTNNVWADSGDIEVTYKVDPDATPTLTLASPLGANLGSASSDEEAEDTAERR